MNTKHYAVIGNPIGHSLSPQIHHTFAQQFNINLCYRPLLVEPGRLAEAIEYFYSLRGLGLNITIPFKEEAYQLTLKRNNTLSDRARLAGAVNTLQLNPDGQLYADNTDGIGLTNDLSTNIGLSLQQKTVLILGAGGATRGVIPALIEAGAKHIHIANRTVEKSQRLANDFSKAKNISTSGLDNIPEQHYDVIINATSSSLSNDVPKINADLLHKEILAYDMMYAKTPTPFITWCQSHSINRCHDGLGMLVEQAAQAFFLWHQQQPDTQSVLKALRQSL